MDLMFFQSYGTLEDMMVAFHFGEELISGDGNYRGRVKTFIDDVNELREDMRKIVSPRQATVKDVFKLLREYLEKDQNINKDIIQVVEKIMEDK